jgi:hypothetical protein
MLVLLFLFVVIQKKRDIIFACGGTVQNRFFFVELGISLLFPEGKRNH